MLVCVAGTSAPLPPPAQALAQVVGFSLPFHLFTGTSPQAWDRQVLNKSRVPGWAGNVLRVERGPGEGLVHLGVCVGDVLETAGSALGGPTTGRSPLLRCISKCNQPVVLDSEFNSFTQPQEEADANPGTPVFVGGSAWGRVALRRALVWTILAVQSWI